MTARITSLVGAESRQASKEALDRIVCRVYPKSSGEEPTDEDFAVQFSRADDLVRLAAKGGLVDRLEGWEVESYECLSTVAPSRVVGGSTISTNVTEGWSWRRAMAALVRHAWRC